MSFDKIQFRYNPPPTVAPAPLAAQTAQSAQQAAAAVTDGSATRAAQLIGRLDDLKATSQYLQSLIRAKSQGIGVEINSAAEPALSLALCRLYSQTTPPPGISLDMYNHLLDAETGVMRAEMVLANSPSSSLTVSPVQKADLMLVTKSFEDALAGTGEFRHQIPLLLRELKGDEVIFDGLKSGLQSYPILNGTPYAPQPSTVESATLTVTDDWYKPDNAGTDWLGYQGATADTGLKTQITPQPSDASYAAFIAPARTIDINPQTTAAINQRLDKQEVLYGAMYNLAAKEDEITSYIGEIDRELNQDLQTLIMVCAALRSLQMLFHKPKLDQLKGLIGMLILPRLIAEVSAFNFLLDRMIQRAIAPVENLLNSTSRLVGEASKVSNEIAYLVGEGGLTGTIKSQITGNSKALPKPQRIAALDTLPAYMKKLHGYLSWSVQKARGKIFAIEGSMLKSMDRRLQVSGDRLEIMGSLQSVTSLISIVRNLILTRQRGSSSQSGAALSTISGIASGGALYSLPSPVGAAEKVLQSAGVI